MDPIADSTTGYLPRDVTVSGNMHIADALIGYGPFVLHNTPEILYKLVKPIAWINWHCIKSNVKSYYYENFIINSADDYGRQIVRKMVNILLKPAGSSIGHQIITMFDHDGPEALLKFNEFMFDGCFYNRFMTEFHDCEIFFPILLQQNALINNKVKAQVAMLRLKNIRSQTIAKIQHHLNTKDNNSQNIENNRKINNKKFEPIIEEVEEEEGNSQQDPEISLDYSTASAGTSSASVSSSATSTAEVATASTACQLIPSSSSTPVATATTTASTSRAGQFSFLQLLEEQPNPQQSGNNITYSLDYNDYEFVHGSLQDSPDSTTSQ